MHKFLTFTLGMKLYHVSDSSSVRHQEFITVHMAMVYVIQVCWQLVSSIRMELSSILCVQWKTPDDGQTNCPKHVEFHSKNKFERLVHLVGFIIGSRHSCWQLEVGLYNSAQYFWLIHIEKYKRRTYLMLFFI